MKKTYREKQLDRAEMNSLNRRLRPDFAEDHYGKAQPVQPVLKADGTPTGELWNRRSRRAAKLTWRQVEAINKERLANVSH